MSYNISTCKVRKISDFQIPLSFFYPKAIDSSWYPKVTIDYNTNISTFQFTDCETFKGLVDDKKILHVDYMDLAGEGSGIVYTDIIHDALKNSTGFIEFVLVWERGDTVEIITVEDGKMTTENIV